MIKVGFPVGLVVLLSIGIFSDADSAERFEGLWALSKAECLDEEGPNSRTLISLSNTKAGKPIPIFDQYENHCRIRGTNSFGDGTVLAMKCFEFWDDFAGGKGGRNTSIKLLPTVNGGLQIDGRTYQRCDTKSRAKSAAEEAESGGSQLQQSTARFEVDELERKNETESARIETANRQYSSPAPESQFGSKIRALTCADMARLRPPIRKSSNFNLFGVPDVEWTARLWHALVERAVACGSYDRAFFEILEEKILPAAERFQAARDSARKKDDLLNQLKEADAEQSTETKLKKLDSLSRTTEFTDLSNGDQRAVSGAVASARQAIENKRLAEIYARQRDAETLQQARSKADEERRLGEFKAKIASFSSPVQRLIGLNAPLQNGPIGKEEADAILTRLYTGELSLKLCAKKFGGFFSGLYRDELAEAQRRRKLFESYVLETQVMLDNDLRTQREILGVETATGRLADALSAMPDLPLGCDQTLAGSSVILNFGN